MATLYDLTDKYQRLLELADDVDSEAFDDAMEGITDDITEKAENYAKIDRQLKYDVDALKTEQDRLNRKQRSLEIRKEKLRNNLMDSMAKINTTKIRTKEFSINLQKNSQKPLLITASELPEDYFEYSKKANRVKIKEAIKKGEEVPGAKYGEPGYHITIR